MTEDAHTPFGREDHQYTLSDFTIRVWWSGLRSGERIQNSKEIRILLISILKKLRSQISSSRSRFAVDVLTIDRVNCVTVGVIILYPI